jgi:hypothetical protein
VSNSFQKFGDSDGNGFIDRKEEGNLQTAAGAFLLKPHSSQNDMDAFFGSNGDSDISELELDLAVKAIFFDGIKQFQKIFPEWVPDILDHDHSGKVDPSEFEAVYRFMLSHGRDYQPYQAADKLDTILDQDKNGTISSEEIKYESRLLFPHPVSSKNPLDSKLDRDIDDMINFPEPGITGGFTDKGEIPTPERRISVIRRRGSIAHPTGELVKKNALEGTNLAVLGVKADRDVIGPGDITGIIMFLENAFVNSNAVNVIDRNKTNLVLDEMNFQLSGLVNEESIVEVGNLTGADLLAVSEITKVGGTFYFNVKILEVRTAEIIRSILSQANGPQDFLDMCESAVHDLF